MLQRLKKAHPPRTGGVFTIVASSYNAQYVDGMVKAAVRELKKAGGRTRVIRVPGAFEIPVVAARLAAPADST